MHREIIHPKTNQIVITLPPELLNQELELLIFPTARERKADTKRMMTRVFKDAEKINIAEQLDVDKLMNEMNDAIS